MANELSFRSPLSGLTVAANLYREGAFVTTISLPAQTSGGGPFTVYRASMPSIPEAKYDIIYTSTQYPNEVREETIWWDGTDEIPPGGSATTGSTSDGFAATDRQKLDKILEYGEDASAAAVGSYRADPLLNTAVLRDKNGATKATFTLRNAQGQGSITDVTERIRQ